MNSALMMPYYACYSSFEKNKHCFDAEVRYGFWYINPPEMVRRFSGESQNGMPEWSFPK